MDQEKINEALAVMAEAQRAKLPEGERRCPCDALVGNVGGGLQNLTVMRCNSCVIDALTDHGFFVRVTAGGSCRVEWREGR